MSTSSLPVGYSANSSSKAEPHEAFARDRGRFLVTAVFTSLIHLVLHIAGYSLILRHVLQAYPAGTAEFVKQLERSPEDLVTWAMVLTTFSMGVFITTAMKWANAETATEGMKRGAALGLLFWTSVNSGLYASSRHFSLPAVLVDTPLSALWMALAAAFAGWMLTPHRKKGETHKLDFV